MTKLAQTLGLTEFQTEIIATVRQFVDKEIIPNAAELERADSYPQDIVDQMRDMGLFGLMIPEEHGGLGESLLTYALCVEELARGWMSISGVLNAHFIVAYMLRQHGTDEQKQRFPAAHGNRRVPRRVFHVRARAGLRCRRDPNPGPTQPGRHLHHQRPEDVGDQRRQFDTGRRAGAHRRGRGQTASQPDRVSCREANGIRRSGAGAGDPGQDRQAWLQGDRHHRTHLRRLPGERGRHPGWHPRGRASSR